MKTYTAYWGISAPAAGKMHADRQEGRQPGSHRVTGQACRQACRQADNQIQPMALARKEKYPAFCMNWEIKQLGVLGALWARKQVHWGTRGKALEKFRVHSLKLQWNFWIADTCGSWKIWPLSRGVRYLELI